VFFPRSHPVTVTRDEIRGLRLSLNTPVVATEEIPIGPARAAILVHEGSRGPEVTIGIRSLRADRIALYGFEGDLREASSFAVALDAALSFAESMGFLFDEDELGTGGAAARVRCLGLWRDLLGDNALGGAVPARGAGGESAEELLLEELAEDAGDDSSDAVLGTFSDASAPEGGATDVFVPQFEGDAAPGGAADFAAAGAPVFASGPAAFADSGVGLDDEASFAGLLDPSDEPVPSESSDPSDEPDEPDETVAEPAPAAAARPSGSAPLVSLTKFRGGLGPPAARRGARDAEREAAEGAPAALASAPAKRAKQALGKLRLIRRSRGGGGASAGARKRHPILRLFGSF
jgi:hypothetical protein